MANFSHLSDFPFCVILEYPEGGAEFSRPLPEGARRFCIEAARSFKRGRERTARDIFLKVLAYSVPEKLLGRLRRCSTTELAELAAFLLDAGKTEKISPELPAPEDIERAARRVIARNQLLKRDK